MYHVCANMTIFKYIKFYTVKFYNSCSTDAFNKNEKNPLLFLISNKTYMTKIYSLTPYAIPTEMVAVFLPILHPILMDLSCHPTAFTLISAWS